MSENNREYTSYQMDIGSEAFKRAFVTHRNALTTAVKRTLKKIDCVGKERFENVEGRSGEKCDLVPPQQLLQKLGN